MQVAPIFFDDTVHAQLTTACNAGDLASLSNAYAQKAVTVSVFFERHCSMAANHSLSDDSPTGLWWGCCKQVAPSFFDAPGAQDSNQANAGMTASPAALPVAPTVTLATAQQLSDNLPNITFAFASEVGYKVSQADMIGDMQAQVLLHCLHVCLHGW